MRGDITGAQARERRFGRTQAHQLHVSSMARGIDETETVACCVCPKCPTSFRGRRVLTGVARRAGPILSVESGSACATSLDRTLAADSWIVCDAADSPEAQPRECHVRIWDPGIRARLQSEQQGGSCSRRCARGEAGYGAVSYHNRDRFLSNAILDPWLTLRV